MAQPDKRQTVTPASSMLPSLTRAMACSEMLRMLHASSLGSLSWHVFVAALEVEFPPGDAERQLDTALEWGRYAESSPIMMPTDGSIWNSFA